MDSGKIGILRQEHAMKPAVHFRKIMKILLKPIFGIDGVSPTGKRGCEGVPEIITETVYC